MTKIQEKTATMNLVAVAQFFDVVCSSIFDKLLATGSKASNLFGPIFTYFGTAETNGQRMLHLHCLIWL